MSIIIDGDFPGGNIVVERIEGTTAWVHQDLRDTQGWWFWWQCRVRGAQGRTLTFRHTLPKPGANRPYYPYSRRGPAVSLDGGLTWGWLGAAAVDASGAFQYAFGPDVAEVRFAFAPPYVAADLERFLARHEGAPALQRRELCRSRQGRVVHRLHAGRLDGRAGFRILVTARHHACESLASFVVEGLLAAVLEESELGRWFQQHAEIMAIPFMDPDGVEAGDQGKNRAPRDHNRDYAGESLYPETRALRALAPAWLDGASGVALDLHCPAPRNGHIYLVGNAAPAVWERQCRFSQFLERSIRGPLPYRAADNLPFGQEWNVATNYADGKACGDWTAELPGMALDASFEVPYADAHTVDVTPDTARLFGRDLACALREYLRDPQGTSHRT